MNRMSRKFVSVISILLSIALVLTACGGNTNTGSQATTSESTQSGGGTSTGSSDTAAADFGNKSPEEYSGEFTMWVWGDYEANVIPYFNKMYPNVKVNLEVIPNTDYVTKLQTTLNSGGDMPDVVLLEMTPRGSLIALDAWEVLSNPPYNIEKENILDYAIPLISNENGDIVSMQEDATMGGIAYNRELTLKYFGTDDPDELEKMFSTWDDFVEKGREVYEKSGGQVTLFTGMNEEGFRLLAGSYYEPWVKDGKLNIESTFKPVYELLQKMNDNHVFAHLDSWSASWNASFANNTVVFYVAPTWFVPHAIKANDPDAQGKYGLMKAPVSYEWGGTALAIPKKAKNKELAWVFIKWLTMSMDGAKAFAEVNNTMTLYKPAMEAGIYSKEDPYFKGQDIMSKYVEIGQETQARPITKYDQIIWNQNANSLKMLETGYSAEEAYNVLVENILNAAPELK